ncbi:MAG TPA: PDZ domain-containing protein [Gammaproteobacteria bacterium]|nr:PDZ domain-containing protein [Gammaproteobacteria bacterium]
MKSMLSTVVLGAVLTGPTLLMADNTLPEQTPPPAAQSQQQNHNWLGLALGPVPPALSAQLGTIIPPSQGVLVTSVTADSPAAKAGLQANDVILSYGDQKLYAPEQLAGLVRSDQPNQTVTLQVAQKGQLNKLQVTLGQRPQPNYPAAQAHPGMRPLWSQRGMPMHRPMPTAPNNPHANQPLAWDSFESVQVNTLPDGRYHAEVSYKNKDNETRNFTFEGKREEVIAQIKQQKDLPDDKKQALLNALNLQPGVMSNFPMMPGGAFNDPFFNQFNQNFFNDFPPIRMPPEFRQFFQPGNNQPQQMLKPQSFM